MVITTKIDIIISISERLKLTSGTIIKANFGYELTNWRERNGFSFTNPNSILGGGRGGEYEDIDKSIYLK